MKKRPLADRFWEKVDKTAEDGCWLWTGAKNRYGYGRIGLYREQPRAAHRVVWFLTHGEWPSLHVCHSCDTPACVNPAHLWLGDARANNLDAIAKGRSIAVKRANQTHCAHGHEFTPENTYFLKTRNGRHCRSCSRERAAERRQADPQASNAYQRAWRQQLRARA